MKTNTTDYTIIFNKNQTFVFSKNNDHLMISLVTQKKCQNAYGSKTSLVMYSRGILGSWCEKTFLTINNQIKHWSVCSWSSEFEITWNWMRPRFCSFLAVSSRDACALNNDASFSIQANSVLTSLTSSFIRDSDASPSVFTRLFNSDSCSSSFRFSK